MYINNEGRSIIDATYSGGFGHIQKGHAVGFGDFDNDGDIDYIAGNHGLNSYYKATINEPLTAYASDFDNNGHIDVVLAGFFKDINGSRKNFPVHFRNDLNKQIDLMKKIKAAFDPNGVLNPGKIFPDEEANHAA